MDAAEALRGVGGCATLSHLLRLTTRASLRAAQARGDVERVAHGVYALPDASAKVKAVTAMRGVISHQTAAAHWLMDAMFPEPGLHLSVPKNNRPIPRKGVTVHHTQVDDEYVTSPLRTVLDCARSMPFHEALAIADSACRIGLVTPDELVTGAVGVSGPGRARAVRVAQHADPGAANPFESGLRAIVIEARVTGFVPQLVIPDAPYMRVDLGDDERRIVLEADSFSYHGDRQALHRDCRRYDELISRGWLVLRFAWEHVMFDRTWVADMIQQTVRLRVATSAHASR